MDLGLNTDLTRVVITIRPRRKYKITVYYINKNRHLTFLGGNLRT